MWAVCTRTDPAEDIETMRQTWGSRVDPLRDKGAPPFNTRAIIDACRPWLRVADFPSGRRGEPGTHRPVVGRWPDVLGGIR